ncbi:MAG: histidinol dehydrogenase, partial [Clostridia bacterium]|nr:histidinol dehydrogenase [Clostridia bacterium]
MIKILKYGEVPNSEIFARAIPKVNVEEAVAQIIENVKARGDEAVLEYCARFDGAKLERLQVSKEEIDEAFAQVDEEFLQVLRLAKENITAFHEKQVRNSFILNDRPGVVM